ncbi:hypothetical protein BV25DRAFT_1813076 [Artomyces pyxidatus]|uniref:Uncharacterized protein n=1 Tax=Artomyces pyxidatus TaxID=48021 RepID=A0ACB8SKU7_9AGAM|nr:hypothetical protein BV25DRAFT_1813076 [Artomyces pyxidatus]
MVSSCVPSPLVSLFSVVFLCLFSTPSLAQQTIFPAATPLLVRSPYLSCWEPTSNGTVFSKAWSRTSTGPILGWAGLVKVDGVSYVWLGDARGIGSNSTNLTSTIFTPTRTILSIQAGPMELTVTFLSPIEPGDWVRQSMPFAYMYLDAKSLDGNAHRVQVYTDVSGEWNSGDRSTDSLLTWTSTITPESIYHAATLQKPGVFQEISQQAQWGTLYIAAKQGSGVTYKTASDQTSRGQFMSQGILDNQLDTNFRSIPGTPGETFPIFAISQDLGTIQSTTNSVVWAIGYSRDPAIQYTDISGATQQRNLYFMSQYQTSDFTGLISDFLNDFSNAEARATQLDAKITADAQKVSSDYVDLISLAARQAYGGTELTIAKGSDGSFNTSDVMMFMKNIGGTTTGRVNPVETLFASFPMFMYIDPSLGAPLLEPLFRFQNTSDYKVGYAAADIGSKYPNATGSNQPHQQGVEQSGNMLIMTYAYARASGDGSLIARYYNLLKTWADYLVANTLFTENQLSGDNESINNQTNLAIKGIIAIQAMSAMSTAINNTEDAQLYSGKVTSLLSQWTSLALGTDNHVLAVYGDMSSWSLGYNLFADRWLGTNLINSSVFDGQTAFFNNLASSNTNLTFFGVPVDSTNTAVTISSWDVFTAAITTDATTRDNLISSVHNRASFNVSAGAFPLDYDSSRGTTVLGVASPAQGAMFAPLALNIPVASIQVNITNPSPAGPSPDTANPASKGAPTGAIVGGILGAIAIILIIVASIWYMRRRRKTGIHVLNYEDVEEALPPHKELTPFAVQDNSLYRPPSEPLYTLSMSEASGGVVVAARSPPSDTEFSQPQTLSDMVFQPPPAPAPLSGKALARLRMMNADSHSRTLSDASAPASASVSGSSSGPRTLGPAGVDPNQLREEVEDLRREMQQIRAERLEPPPSYAGYAEEVGLAS